jgi:hypothetical protein
MGLRFQLEHANFMGYLLSSARSQAPRAKPALLAVAKKLLKL